MSVHADCSAMLHYNTLYVQNKLIPILFDSDKNASAQWKWQEKETHFSLFQENQI